MIAYVCESRPTRGPAGLSWGKRTVGFKPTYRALFATFRGARLAEFVKIGVPPRGQPDFALCRIARFTATASEA
eukprot:12439997-Heterocapsa_arctica.AAC.1